MNTKTTKWLVLTAVALFLFIVFFERRTEETSTVPAKLARLFPDLKPALVTQVEVAFDKLTLRALRTNEAWLLTAPLNYPALATPIEALARATAELRWRTLIPEATWQAQPGGLTNYGLNPRAPSSACNSATTAPNCASAPAPPSATSSTRASATPTPSTSSKPRCSTSSRVRAPTGAAPRSSIWPA